LHRGGGLQYAVTNNWSVFAEYRFSDFGTLRDNNLVALLAAGAFFNADRRLQESQVQAGFSYKFDTYAPCSGRRQILIAPPLVD
jgi:outer membrane immunogenic protein